MTQKKLVGAAVLSLFTMTAAFADATVDQKTRVQFGGALGGVLNKFGGKSTREGIESTTVVKGNRKLTRTGESGELVDLSEEKVYTIDFSRQSYSVKTFAEIRKQLEDAMKNSEKESKEEGRGKGEKGGPEYEVDFAVKETGKKETINGFNTKQVIVTVTVREQGKKLEQSGGSVLTSDMWMAPKVAAMSEIADFDARYYKKLYGGLMSGVEMQQMMALMAASPTVGKAMKVFSEKKSSLEGTPIRAIMKFETVAGSEQKTESASSDEESAPTSAGAMVGGLLGRAMKKRAESKEPEEAATPGRSKLFESTSDTLRADGRADASVLAVPAGFKQRR